MSDQESTDGACADRIPRRDAIDMLEAERSLIAHEIHDGIIPYLFVARSALQQQIQRLTESVTATSTDPPAAADDLDDPLQRYRQLHDWISEAMRVSRDILSQSYLPDFECGDWFDEARQLTSRLYGSGCGIRFIDHVDHCDLDPASATAAYRIVIEAIRNSVRHASATNIIATRQSDEHEMQVTIRDDGIGFDPDRVALDRYGLRTMRQRASLVGGRLEILSRPGGPTTVQLRCPF